MSEVERAVADRIPDPYLAMIWLVTGMPALLLGVSYAYLAVYHGAWNLMPVVVHESGRYTLLETLFYFSHFARELPVCIFLAGALSAAFAWTMPQTQPVAAQADLPRPHLRWLLVVYLVATVAGGVSTVGWEEWYWNLAQFRKRDEWFEYGSHWGYHFWHVVHFLIASAGVALLARGWQGLGLREIRFRSGPVMIWCVMFAAACVIWRVDHRVSTDPLDRGHQLREIVTHSLITLPLGTAALLWAERRWGLSPRPSRAPSRATVAAGLGIVLASGLVPLLLYLGIRSVDLSTVALRDVNWPRDFFSHNFEHALDYVAVVLMAALSVGWILTVENNVRRRSLS